MIKREPTLPPDLYYPIEEWRWVERSFTPQFLPQAETVFTVSNGYLGLRGAFEEGEPAYRNGTFVNGFHETWRIPCGESAFGFARAGQTVPDAKIVGLYVDDEPFDLSAARIGRFERALRHAGGDARSPGPLGDAGGSAALDRVTTSGLVPREARRSVGNTNALRPRSPAAGPHPHDVSPQPRTLEPCWSRRHSAHYEPPGGSREPARASVMLCETHGRRQPAGSPLMAPHGAGTTACAAPPSRSGQGVAAPGAGGAGPGAAGERAPPPWARRACTTAGSGTIAMTCSRPPQRGQARTSRATRGASTPPRSTHRRAPASTLGPERRQASFANLLGRGERALGCVDFFGRVEDPGAIAHRVGAER